MRQVSISKQEKEDLAEALYRAEVERHPIAPLTDSYPHLSMEDAYAIQLEVLSRKLLRGARAGACVVGRKIGLTSKAMQQMFGVEQPDFGHLLDTMAVPNGSEVRIEQLLQPRAEGEIAFVLKQQLQGPGITEGDVLNATEHVRPAIEIVDSRIQDWRIRLADTVADNASSGLFVLGDSALPPAGLDLPLLGMVLDHNGEVALTGAGAAVLGNPATAVAWLANKLAELGSCLRAGEIVLSGAVSAAIPVRRGDVVRVTFAQLGSTSVRFE